MTFPLRMLTQVMQNTVGDHMTKYEHYQALKISELELMKKLHSFVMFRNCFPNHCFFMISFDAEGWCTKWRDETVRDVMKKMFDNQFNTEIFQKTQKIFENSLIWAPNNQHIYFLDGQPGGIEGLAQYVWTFIYRYQALQSISSLYKAERMLIKGDDLRIALVVDKSQMQGMNENEFARSIMKKFKHQMSLFGHTIKVSESYCSSIFLAFSKMFRHDDVVYSSMLRKAQKIHGYSNSLIPTLDDQIASIFSNAHGSGLYGSARLVYFTLHVLCQH